MLSNDWQFKLKFISVVVLKHWYMRTAQEVCQIPKVMALSPTESESSEGRTQTIWPFKIR